MSPEVILDDHQVLPPRLGAHLEDAPHDPSLFVPHARADEIIQADPAHSSLDEPGIFSTMWRRSQRSQS